jgi:hypothetical protein
MKVCDEALQRRVTLFSFSFSFKGKAGMGTVPFAIE